MSCKCYHADRNFIGKIGVCWGTKECEPCSCNGDEAKCDFYDYVRDRAKKTITSTDRKDGNMETENNVLICYEREMNYIAKQIKIIFRLGKVEVVHDIMGNYFLIVCKGHPFF